MSPPRVLGVDAYRHGWVGVVLVGGFAGAYVARHLDELVAAATLDGTPEAVAVDMPIGLPDTGPRQADRLARERIGVLRSSVFATPVRAALEKDSYPAALQVARERAGAGLSRQAYALRPKLLEVDEWVRDHPDRVVEVHPEVSFAALAGRPLTAGKKTWAGMAHRRELLATAGIAVPDDLGAAGVAGTDDVLDAAVAAWTAHRIARGRARSLPVRPEVFTDGLAAAIWY